MKSLIQKFCFALTIAGIATACSKDPVITNPPATKKLVKLDNIVFDTFTSKALQTHALAIDTNAAAYTLNGFGAFAGKTRIVKFTTGNTYQGIPVVQASGMDDYGYTYLAKDTAGNIQELYKKKFNATGILMPQPMTIFAPKQVAATTEWNAFSGWEQGRNTFYFTFKTKVLNTNATTSTGITSCIQLEYSAPDYTDTVYFKTGKGPVEIRSWRAHLYETNQSAYGGYR